MKELTQQEINSVSGAGVIQDALTSAGNAVGESLYGAIANISIELPVIGSISLGTVLPDLGKNLGSTLGSQIGGIIEGAIAGLPLVGGWLNKLLGN